MFMLKLQQNLHAQTLHGLETITKNPVQLLALSSSLLGPRLRIMLREGICGVPTEGPQNIEKVLN